MKHDPATGCAIEIVQTVQTNRPNSSGLTAHQCPWLRPGHRPNNGCGRKAVDSESQPVACRGARFPASGAFEFQAPAVLRPPRYAIRCSAQNRLHIYSYELHRFRPRFTRSSGRHVEVPDAMQVKPMMGMETRPIAPTSPSAGRDVNRKTFKSEMADGTKHCRHALQTPDHRRTGRCRVRGRIDRDGRPGRQDRQRRTDDGRHLAPRQGQRERCTPRGRGNQCEGAHDRRQEDHAATRRAG
ncbi:hypothetical protein BLA6860_07721 [Burkholderia lata]|nr:hypothetical protein BLA6860_07721 [Burkholderia lata]